MMVPAALLWGFVSGRAKKVLLNPYVIIAILFALLGWFAWYQHGKATELEAQNEQLVVAVENRDQEIKLIRADVARQREINADLSAQREAANRRYAALSDRLDTLTNITIPSIETPEDAERVKAMVQYELTNSYNCIMVASGNTKVQCND